MSKRSANESAGGQPKKFRDAQASDKAVADSDADINAPSSASKPLAAVTKPKSAHVKNTSSVADKSSAAGESSANESNNAEEGDEAVEGDNDGLPVDPADPGGKIDPLVYTRRTRPAPRPTGGKADVFVSPGRPLAPVIKRITTLLFTDNLTSIVVHGMGPGGIFAAVKAAVDVTDKHQPWVKTSTTTDTNVVIDDYIPVTGEGALSFTRARRVSTIRILMMKTARGASMR